MQSSRRTKTTLATVAGRGIKPWPTKKAKRPGLSTSKTKRFLPARTIIKTKAKTKTTKTTKTKKTKKIATFKAPYRDIFGKFAVRPKPVKKRRKVLPKPVKPPKKRKPLPKPTKPVKKLRKLIKPTRKVHPKKAPPVKLRKPPKKVAKPSKPVSKKPGPKKLAKKPVKPIKKKPVKKKPTKKAKPVEIPKRRITQIFGKSRKEKIRPVTEEDRERIKEALLDIEEVRKQTRKAKLPFGPTEISPLGYEYYELIAALEKMSAHDVYTLFMSP